MCAFRAVSWALRGLGGRRGVRGTVQEGGCRHLGVCGRGEGRRGKAATVGVQRGQLLGVCVGGRV